MKKIHLSYGQVTHKNIETPNHFVSHMIEHIAWRMGCSIELEWDDENWEELGLAFGKGIGEFPVQAQEAAALGMIDDGSAEVSVQLASEPKLQLQSSSKIEIDYFLSLRCEQLSSGEPLISFLTGMTRGIGAQINVFVCSLQDPHHTWEGVFRGVGTALQTIYAPTQTSGKFSNEQSSGSNTEGIEISNCSCNGVTISRRTAESELEVAIDFSSPTKVFLQYEGAPIDHFDGKRTFAGLEDLLNTIATTCGFHLTALFTSKALSSSHVLLEDTGMVLGRALREILVLRMADKGINGAGSSINTPSDIVDQDISAGISVEGRKSCLFVPLVTDHFELYKNFIIGKSVFGGLYTEDLDDFFDGFSWGLGCSLLFHFKQIPEVEEGWQQLFTNFAIALNQVFEINQGRKGVPPGVKANLF
ncbi:MAG: hypothetical protein GY702_26315 [Desulfobulbaceae bacterium]|nr:hypothetical protein [Desulfobulbaceae bacterium]